MDKLREEIIEAEKIRADLIKWKLILVAGLGAAGLGLNGNSCDDMTLLLCLIPFVCVYVDLVARHFNLRIHVIAEFTGKDVIKLPVLPPAQVDASPRGFGAQLSRTMFEL